MNAEDIQIREPHDDEPAPYIYLDDPLGVIDPERTELEGEELAELVLARLSVIDGDIIGLEARKAAVVAQFDDQIRAKRYAREFIEQQAKPKLRLLAEERITGKKKGNALFTFGKLAFSWSDGTRKPLKGAVDWCKKNGQLQAIESEEKVLVSELTCGFEELKKSGVFEVTDPGRIFKIETGVGK